MKLFKKPEKKNLVWKIPAASFFTIDIFDINIESAKFRAYQQAKNIENWLRLRMN